MATKTKKEESINDLFIMMLKKAGMKKEDVYKASMKNFIINNLDLLTASELKQYEHLLAK